MILDDRNGLARMIKAETGGAARVYLDGCRVSVHWYGATAQQVARLKVLIDNYIDVNMMMQSYTTVSFYS